MTRLPPLLGLALLAGCAPGGPKSGVIPARPPAATSAAADEPLMPSDEPLPPGTPFPPLRAVGWVNGPPPDPAAGPAATVVDLWSDWCPFCRQTAPGLVKVYEKYKGRGVTFVSLTNADRGMAEGFAGQFKADWPSGYGTTADTFAAYGARIPPGNPVAVYTVLPTLYLLGPDGKVRWGDGGARYKHVKPEKLVQDLDEQIEKFLGAK